MRPESDPTLAGKGKLVKQGLVILPARLGTSELTRDLDRFLAAMGVAPGGRSTYATDFHAIGETWGRGIVKQSARP